LRLLLSSGVSIAEKDSILELNRGSFIFNLKSIDLQTFLRCSCTLPQYFFIAVATESWGWDELMLSHSIWWNTRAIATFNPSSFYFAASGLRSHSRTISTFDAKLLESKGLSLDTG
jgi:hypothetical protein